MPVRFYHSPRRPTHLNTNAAGSSARSERPNLLWAQGRLRPSAAKHTELTAARPWTPIWALSAAEAKGLTLGQVFDR